MENTTYNHIVAILDKTFAVLDKAYSVNDESEGSANVNSTGTRLIFPHYSKKHRGGKKRLSEQELRFCFIEQFIKYCDENGWDAYYSVETPTEGKYCFSEKGKDPHFCQDDKDGRSAMFDIVIHDNNCKRICYIEFKAQNPNGVSYKKDFVKLEAEAELGFFVQVLEKEGDGTMKNILENKISPHPRNNNEYVCHVINGVTYYLSSKYSVDNNWKSLGNQEE